MGWTPEQEQAISARNGTLLLQAAAGSGKTSVLTERVVRLLTDENDPCRPDELLVVTFTNAAAAEMRIRIFDKVNELIKQNPGKPFYTNLRASLESARICTIDSFCIRLVREYFHEAGVSPDFRLLDPGESRLLASSAAARVLETMHTEASPAFRSLCALFEQGTGDGLLVDSVIKLYEYSRAYPFPDRWLDGVASYYHAMPLEQTAWGKSLLAELEKGLRYCSSLYACSLAEIAGDEMLCDKLGAFLRTEQQQFDRAADAVLNGWDAAAEATENIVFVRYPSVRVCKDDTAKENAKARRDFCKKECESLKKLLPATQSEHEEDMAVLSDAVCSLLQAVRLFADELTAEKADLNAYDFSDISGAALRLLVHDEDGTPVRTPLAEELSRTYREILVDEYQDTNEAQDMLFRALSKEEKNLFMVGDVKQSIYQFRLAMPSIFIAKSETFPMYDGTAERSKIVLGKNFRSRQGIVDAVNYLFSRIMHKETGEMEYDENEKLVYAGNYAEHGEPDAEWHIVESSGLTKKEMLRAEAAYIAKQIETMLGQGLTVETKEGTRRAEAGDFCILLRTATGVAPVFCEELKKRHIAAASEKSTGFFDTAEIRQMLSLLRTVNDPLQDVDTLAVLFSPLYGMTADEAARIRLTERKAPVFRCLQHAAEKGSEKAKRFLQDTDSLRDILRSGGCTGLLDEIYERTGMPAVVSAMENGELRRKNLYLLREFASSYDKNRSGGLSGFLRYMDDLRTSGYRQEGAAGVPSVSGAVHIMSIHRSKGLEFPFVFIADTARPFNKQDMVSTLLLSHDMGVGIKRQERESLRRYDTVASAAVRQRKAGAANAEQMRLLYVAMTRAREKLILVTSYENAGKKCREGALFLSPDGMPSGYRTGKAGCFADWLLSAYITHPDARALRPFYVPVGYGAAPMRFVVTVAPTETDENTEREEPAVPDEELLAELRKRTSYVYPYAVLSSAPVKRTASDLYAEKFDTDFFAVSKPAFLCSGGLTPAERGTAVHKFLQFCDMQAGADDPAAETKRLLAAGRLTEREAGGIDFAKTAAFLRSDTAERAKKAEKLYREMQFTIGVPAGRFDDTLPDYAACETTVVVGKIDMLFIESDGAVLVDYKTDRIGNLRELIDRYTTQMRMYAEAALAVTGVSVKEIILYSIRLGREIRLAVPDKNTSENGI